MRQTRKRRYKLPYLLAGTIVFVGVAALLFFFKPWHQTASVSPKTNSSAKSDSSNNTKDTTIRFIATGDQLPHDSVNANAKTIYGSYDYLPFFSQVKSYLTSADMAFCNQEAPSDPNRAVSGYPTFNAPASFANDLSTVGCNVINLANNHANDKGQAGITATRQVWAKLPAFAVAGTASSVAEQSSGAYFTVKGVKFAFLSYSQCSNNTSVSSYGLNIFSQQLADAQISAARAQNVDMIVAAMHSCDENSSTEATWQDQTAQYFANKGVDIVIGTGPHWLQPAKLLPRNGGGTTAVWFSLGNFLNTQLDVNGLIGGIAVMDIDIKTKTVTSLGFMPTYMHYEWTAAQKAADNLLARHDLLLYPLDQASEVMIRSQNNTTVDAQTARVTNLMNTYTTVTMYTSKAYPGSPKL